MIRGGSLAGHAGTQTKFKNRHHSAHRICCSILYIMRYLVLCSTTLVRARADLHASIQTRSHREYAIVVDITLYSYPSFQCRTARAHLELFVFIKNAPGVYFWHMRLFSITINLHKYFLWFSTCKHSFVGYCSVWGVVAVVIADYASLGMLQDRSLF